MNQRSTLSVSILSLFLCTSLAACAGDFEEDTTDTWAHDDGESFPSDEPIGVNESALSSSGLPMVSLTFSESGVNFLNPERGYYASVNLLSPTNMPGLRGKGHTLALAIVRLDAYRHSALDSTLLNGLKNGFAAARANGIKVILRFTYNASASEDASRSRILGHIGQLAPILQQNADVIAVMQAGFIGAWGEWHSSTNGLDNTAARNEILNAILAALPASRSVQVRTPMFKAGLFPGAAMGSSDAFTGSARSRMGHHNDCFLASSSDFGTYASPVADWKAYVASEGRFTPVGGETCAVSSRTSCATALTEMNDHHWSYLNKEYKADVINSWDAGGCGSSIRRRLGYRFVAKRFAYSKSVAPGGVLEVELDIANTGFAAAFNRRPAYIVLSGNGTRKVARLNAGVDVRRWTPGGAVTKMAVKLRVPAGMAVGSYKLGLWMPDHTDTLRADPRYAIRLANDGLFDEVTGDNIMTTTFKIAADAPGAKDPSATTFVEIL